MCIDERLSKPVALYRGKHVVNGFMKAILNECRYCRLVIKKHLRKNVAMTIDDEKSFK